LVAFLFVAPKWSLDAPSQVQVAPGGNLAYSPANFTAANGTTVTFFFPSYVFTPTIIILFAMLTCAVCRGAFPHSVTQGSFANPCVYLAAEGGNPAGFDSGLQSGGKELSIKITNDQERK
jgi:hypothetical protein